MQEVIGVQYKTASKIYYFDPEGEKYDVGTEVIVNTVSGPAFAVVAQGNKMVEDAEVESPLKTVIRIATDKDKEHILYLKTKGEKHTPIIEGKISKLKLPMKVVDVQYSFDESKVTITYTSDDRVDFRELLKVLASTLRVKIELRQIGIRDEVRLVGAMGLCGRPCCCTTFLKESEHVVVKMAKNQNLSLSPTKTGGACGKMMCCLAYEDPVYKEILSKMPKVGSKIKTPEGDGVVQYNNILKQNVTIKVFYNEDNYKFIEYNLEQLQENVDNEQTKNKNNQTLQTQQNLVAHNANNNYNNYVEKVDLQEKTNSNEILNGDTPQNNRNDNKRKKFKHHFKKRKGDRSNGIQN